ncbi:hypothetical protein Asulf_01375 [Archaeoglobus sulfaticallidus PM70-1]|uniref:Restriction endonuclease n=1 Tax=Archaeoglobus sulfaticallidus PM70-1 TaxID=387631 RepID=N0BLE5_9EURY|nr:HincII family type II restriction endonuclease [Archaeoglobus sulfaticallidus]AGK61366.1 hypothetical protein Asulf_01375 [Archaeoglobus sulfaticallidus PM70-1]
MNLLEIRRMVESCLSTAKGQVVNDVAIMSRASGSASGLPFEEWTKNKLNECGFKTFLQEEYLLEVVRELKEKGHSNSQIERIIRDTWWGTSNYMISRNQLNHAFNQHALNQNDPPAYQQSIADIILFYGNDLVDNINDIVAINVKSHNLDRPSRDPNIISAKRIIDYMKDILETKPSIIDKVNLWFIGIYYRQSSGYASIEEIYIKDFFRLDVKKIPTINFDAAIQIQWHVKDMVELESQDKLTFIESLAEEFNKRWVEFVDRRTASIEETLNTLRTLIKKYRNKKTLFDYMV